MNTTKKLLSLFLAVSLMTSLFARMSCIPACATCSLGIMNNGLDGLWLDINAHPYTYFESKPFGDHAYKTDGCAWFASARSYQITGVDCNISSGTSWYKGGRWNLYGYSIGQICKAKSLACYSDHILVVEKVVGNNVLISEGGQWGYSDYAHGYCTIRWTTIDKVESNQFLGYVYLTDQPDEFTHENLGDHFFANILHQKSGKAVVSSGDNLGSNVQIDTYNGSLTQKWEFIRQSDGAYQIINASSGKSLDVYDGSNLNNTNVHIWDRNESAAQLWYLKKAASGYQLVPKCALNSALDLENGSSLNGTNIQIYSRLDDNNTSFTNQVFSFNYLPSFETENLGDHFFANILHQKSGKAVVSSGDSLGSNVQIDTYNGSLIQKWEFIRQSDGAYQIINASSGKSLDVYDGSNLNNTNVHIWDRNESAAQLWYLKKAASGYQLVPKCALNSALDLENGSSLNGTNIQIYSRLDDNNTSFTNQVFFIKIFEALNFVPGDLDGNGSITDADAVYFLMYTFFPKDYPINQPCDYDGDGKVTDADAIYLLMFTFFPEDYPIQ